MKNRKNSSTGDLEAVSLVAGVILVLCFGMMIFDLEAAPVFMTLVIAMGVIMNGTAALERFYMLPDMPLDATQTYIPQGINHDFNKA